MDDERGTRRTVRVSHREIPIKGRVRVGLRSSSNSPEGAVARAKSKHRICEGEPAVKSTG